MSSVSVVIPAYNSAQTIRSTLDSVLAQTISPDEIIVVDDGSTDNTVETVTRYTRHLTREIVLLRMEKNAGPAATRNRGIKEAKGEWIAFLDGDDEWLPEKLELQMKATEEDSDVDMWCGGVVPLERVEDRGQRTEGEDERTEDRGQKTGREEDRGQKTAANPLTTNTNQPTTGDPRELKLAELAITNPLTPNTEQPTTGDARELTLSHFAISNPVATSTVMVKKSVLDGVGGFDEQFRGPEDYDLWMRVAVNAKIVKLDISLTRYRVESGSLSMDDRTFLPAVLRVIDKAYSVGGVLDDMKHLKRASVAGQYWSASWMAFNRGARSIALKHWVSSFVRSPSCEGRSLRKQLALLVRYLFGRIKHGDIER